MQNENCMKMALKMTRNLSRTDEDSFIKSMASCQREKNELQPVDNTTSWRRLSSRCGWRKCTVQQSAKMENMKQIRKFLISWLTLDFSHFRIQHFSGSKFQYFHEIKVSHQKCCNTEQNSREIENYSFESHDDKDHSRISPLISRTYKFIPNPTWQLTFLVSRVHTSRLIWWFFFLLPWCVVFLFHFFEKREIISS